MGLIVVSPSTCKTLVKLCHAHVVFFTVFVMSRQEWVFMGYMHARTYTGYIHDVQCVSCMREATYMLHYSLAGRDANHSHTHQNCQV